MTPMTAVTTPRPDTAKPVRRCLEPTPAMPFAWLGLCYWTIPWEC